MDKQDETDSTKYRPTWKHQNRQRGPPTYGKPQHMYLPLFKRMPNTAPIGRHTTLVNLVRRKERYFEQVVPHYCHATQQRLIPQLLDRIQNAIAPVITVARGTPTITQRLRDSLTTNNRANAEISFSSNTSQISDSPQYTTGLRLELESATNPFALPSRQISSISPDESENGTQPSRTTVEGEQQHLGLEQQHHHHRRRRANPDAQVNIRNARNVVQTFEGQIHHVDEAAAAPHTHPKSRPQHTTNTATLILMKAFLHAMTAETFETSRAQKTHKTKST
jgi:hypothetical protein